MKSSLSNVLGKRLTKYLNSLHEVYLPQQLFELVGDTERHEAYRHALAAILEKKTGAHVLQAERGSIILAMEAIRLGASRVTICEPWNSLASLYEMIINTNDFLGKIVILRKKLVDVSVKDLWTETLPSVLLCNNLDSGLLGYGVQATLDYAETHLLSDDADVVPKRAKVYACPIELLTAKINGFDLSSFNRYRWSLFYDRLQLGEEPYRKMADVVCCGEFDFYQPSIWKSQSLEFTSLNSGTINAIAFWFELQLYGEITLVNAPPTLKTSSWHQALQYLNESLTVETNQSIKIDSSIRSHGILFSLEGEKERSPLLSLKPVVPTWHFPMLADTGRNDSYESAIKSAVKKHPSAHVLDIGTGTGLLALMAANAGAQHITACERISHIAEVANNNIVRNGASDRINVINKDSHALSVACDMPQKANVLISETVDHSLLGEGFLGSLMHARLHLMEENPTIIPASAIVYAVPLELRTAEVAGFDLSALNLFHQRHYQGVKLGETPHRFLSEPFEAFHFNFYDQSFEPQRKFFEVEVNDKGICNAVAFWYHLFLDEETAISTAPNSDITAWDQAVIFFDTEFLVDRGQILPITGEANLHSIQFDIEPLSYMLEGGISNALEIPIWFNELLREEEEMQNSTEAISAAIEDEYPYIAKATFETLVAQYTALGYDIGLFSDFITQIYNCSRLNHS